MNALASGAVLGALGVVAGAFGAHGLQGRLPPDRLAVFEIAVRYQLVHALALVGVGILVRQGMADLGATTLLYVGGVVLFSGSLYGLALGAPRWLAYATPLGGLMLVGGWVLLALAARGR